MSRRMSPVSDICMNFVVTRSVGLELCGQSLPVETVSPVLVFLVFRDAQGFLY